MHDFANGLCPRSSRYAKAVTGYLSQNLNNVAFAHYNEIAGRNAKRIEAVSDGVFAIAMTLLVLDVKVPIGEAVASEAELIQSFSTLLPKLLVYFLSFMTCGIFWTGHATQFNHIDKSDRNLNWISLFFLLFVSIIPFTTAFLSEHINYKLPIFLYWLNLFFLGLLLLINWTYARKHKFTTLNQTDDTRIHHAIRRRIVTAQGLYFLGALLCFINSYVSIGAIILIQLNYAFGIINSISSRKNTK